MIPRIAPKGFVGAGRRWETLADTLRRTRRRNGFFRGQEDGPIPQRRAFQTVSREADETEEDFRRRKERMEKRKRDITILGLGTNIALAVGKFVIGYEMGSSALVADAVHSASDGVSDIVALGSLAISSQPPSAKQPFGYGHFDTLGSLVLGLSLVAAGMGSGYFAVQDLIEYSLRPPVVTTHMKEIPLQLAQVAGASIVLSVLAKEWLFRVTYKLGKETRSNVLIANAMHHRTDSLSSIVAGFGILGSFYGIPLLDPVAALVVNGMVIKAGVEVAWDAIGDLTDRQDSADHAESCAKIKQVAARLAASTEIVNVHDVRLRRMGSIRIVDLHVVVDPTLSVTASYHAGQRLRKAILEELPDITEVFVHIDAGADAFLGPTAASPGPASSSSSGEDNNGETTNGDFSDLDDGFARSRVHEQKLPKSHYQIEAEVRKTVAEVGRTSVPFLRGVSHVNVHYVVQEKNQAAKAIVEVNLMVDATRRDLRFSELEEAGKLVRRALLNGVDGLDSVDVHVQLGDEDSVFPR